MQCFTKLHWEGFFAVLRMTLVGIVILNEVKDLV